MLPTFYTGKTLSRSANVAPEDVLRIKSALSGLGLYKPPKWGITPYPDPGLFGAVEDFQRKNKLKVDGTLKPGGPTEKVLNKVLALPRTEAATSQRISYTPDDGAPDTPQPEPAAPDTRVALGPGAALLLPPLIAGASRIAPRVLREASRLFSAAQAAKILEDASKGEDSKTKVAPRTSIIPPMPPLPPSEPPEEKDKLQQKEEFPADPPQLPSKSENIPPKIMPSTEIFPELDDELKNSDLIVESKGNAATKAELDRIRDYYISLGWVHEAGGRDADTGEEIPEFWIGGPGKAFPTGNRKPGKGDGRQGGKRSDLTFRKPDGTIVHIQSVDVDKNGKPTQREQDNAYRIWMRTEGEQVILHPKGAQMKK